MTATRNLSQEYRDLSRASMRNYYDVRRFDGHRTAAPHLWIARGYAAMAKLTEPPKETSRAEVTS